MSIASEITRLQTAKANIKTSIENKGVVVSSSDKLDDYSSLIDSINISTQVKTVNPQNYTREITPDVGYRGLSKVVLDGVLVDAHDSYTSTTDDDVAYEKIVPSGALKYASLDKLGGMSYKSENLCPTATYNGVMNNTIAKSIVFGNLPNGTYSISFNVLANANNRTFIIYYVDNGVVNTTNVINTNLNGTGQKSYTFTISNSITYDDIIFGINSGSNDYAIQLENLMLVKGSTALPYQPYFTNIRDSAVTSVKSYGMNVWDEQWELGKYDQTTGQKVSANNIIRCSNYIDVNPNKTYYFKGVSNLSQRVFYYDSQNNYLSNVVVASNTTFTTPNNCYYLRFNLSIEYGTTYNNDICINLSSSADGTYKPYVAPITKTIPTEIQALNGYGWGVNSSCYNYIDFENKKFIQKVGKYIVDENTNIFSLGGYWYLNQNNFTGVKSSAKVLESKEYFNTTFESNKNLKSNITTDYTGIEFSEMINGDIIYYELDTPVETDISQYLDDNTIEVEEKGTLVSNNTYNQAVPSEITYLVEV